jgi:hypothetical protein
VRLPQGRLVWLQHRRSIGAGSYLIRLWRFYEKLGFRDVKLTQAVIEWSHLIVSEWFASRTSFAVQGTKCIQQNCLT